MTRRLLILSPLILPSLLANSPAPADPDKLNRFVKAWNEYTDKLFKLGIRSIELWAIVERRFYQLTS